MGLQGFADLAGGNVNGIAALGNRVYTANRNSSTLSVNDAESGALLGTIPVGGLPWGVAAAGERVYVVNFSDNSLSLIDATDDSLLTTVTIGSLPAFVAATADGAYVTHLTGWLSLVSPAGQVLANWRPGPSDLWDLTLNRDGSRLYLGSRNEERVIVLSTADQQVVGSIPLPGQPYALAVNDATGHLFAVDAAEDAIYVVDLAADNALLGQVALSPQGADDGGQGLVVSQNRVYVAHWQDRSLTILQDGVCGE